MKKKDDRLGSDPFENVLTHLSDSRKKKDDDTSDGASESADVITSKDASNDTSIGAGKSNSKDTSTDNGANKNASKVTSNKVSDVASASNDKSADTFTSNGTSNAASTDNSISKSVSEVTDVSNGDGESAVAVTGGSIITIARRKEKSALVKMTYYLRPDQIQAIDDLHDQSGRDKSELVRMALDIMIERAKVE